MKRSETAVLMNLCMVCSGEKVLVLERSKRDWPGVTFPGGHVENGESFTDAVVREVREETGLTVSAPQLCGIEDWCEDGVRYMPALPRRSVYRATAKLGGGQGLVGTPQRAALAAPVP